MYVCYCHTIVSCDLSRCKARQHKWQKNKKGLHCWISHSRGILNRAVANLTVLGGQEFHFPHFFPQISINFSSNFTYFLPHFGPPGGRVAHPGRPWLRHWYWMEFMLPWRTTWQIANSLVSDCAQCRTSRTIRKTAGDYPGLLTIGQSTLIHSMSQECCAINPENGKPNKWAHMVELSFEKRNQPQ